ncbi:hypothetical protein CAPTEDRAFT_209607 [Capitella teleta]|uniref:Gustatory receptor n=1 Tax=Capitella teleta TaxID=283909 RepID=R7TAN0_CAPTE|nr:hypothetical protein CAPTEDRAFT_209607 [Capitella teleta]|eukprot:ELT90557.1 hypothetical protein CAPTEDRAFT_209607 [Capitella teleta]
MKSETTCTRKTRMLYMEQEVSEASNVTPSPSSEKKEEEQPKEEEEKKKEDEGQEPAMLSPNQSSSNLRRRSLGSVSPVRRSTLPEVDVDKKELVTSTDVEKSETAEKIDELNLSFKKTATQISNAIVASRPLQQTSTSPAGARKRPPFKKTASTLGKAVVGLKGIGKSLHHNDELDSLMDTMLYDILKPLLLCMKACGIFFVRPKGAALFESSARCLKSVSVAQIYCLLVLFVVTVNLLSASRCAFFNVMWYMKKNGLQALFISIEKICYSDGIIPYERALKQTLKQLSITMVVFGSFAFCSFVYGFFGNDDVSELFETVLAPVSRDAPYIVVYKCFFLVVIGLNIVISCLSIAFYIMLCYIIYKEFEYMCRTFEMKIRADGQFVDDLEKFRIAHQQRCKLVEQADQILKYLLASTFTAHVPLLCLLLYNLLDMSQSLIFRMYGVYWMLMVLTQTLSFAIAATMVNTQAHAPLANIYAIKAASSTIDRQLVVSMFLNKLTGTSIGLTAWDMFVINKPTMLTVMGMVLTYFFLLVQFRNPLQTTSYDKTCNCNLFNVTSNSTLDELITAASK